VVPDTRQELPKPTRPLLLAISAALTALALGAVWVLADSPHSPNPGPPPATASPSPACTGMALTSASNVQAAISTAPPGTTFCFDAGIYHVSSLAPKSGDVLDGGAGRAILDGGHEAAYAVDGDSASVGPSGVTIRGFVIQDFSTPPQRGAIQDYNGPGWIIEDNHITKNAAAGIATGDGVQVLDNLIDHNGQEGFSAHGHGGLYEGNDIAYNNFNLAVDPTWEAGGGKAWATQDLTFRLNYVHNNGGPGLWADTNNIYTTFYGNMVSSNWGPGIYEEISYDATIVDNTVVNNGMPSSPGGGQRRRWAWDAGIQLRESGSPRASSPLIISGNTVTDNYNGISLIQSPTLGCTWKGEGRYGSCNVQNVLVENNWITMSQGATGAYQDGAGNGIFTRQNDIFSNNHYCVASITHPHDGYAYGWFAWMNGWLDFSMWQVSWLEAGGTFTVGGTCHPSSGVAGTSRLKLWSYVRGSSPDVSEWDGHSSYCGRAVMPPPAFGLSPNRGAGDEAFTAGRPCERPPCSTHCRCAVVQAEPARGRAWLLLPHLRRGCDAHGRNRSG
jgi:parallel beta-helix repeat protein